MRQMPQFLREAGLDLIASFAYVVADMGRADFWEPLLTSLVKLLPRAGAMTDSEAADWTAAMRRRSDQGTFFGASNYYAYIARKPRS